MGNRTIWGISCHTYREEARGALGSGFVDQSQKMTVAARATAEKKAVGQRSYRVATRRQSILLSYRRSGRSQSRYGKTGR